MADINAVGPIGRRVLRLKVAAERCGTHVCTPRRWATEARYAHLGFPQAIQMADGSVGFFEHEIDQWLASRPRIGVEA